MSLWTKEDDAKLLEMRNKGMARPAIAARIGRSDEAVRRRFRELYGTSVPPTIGAAEVMPRIDAFLKASRMPATLLGSRACGDSQIVRRLRDGLRIRVSSWDNLQAFMASAAPADFEPSKSGNSNNPTNPKAAIGLGDVARAKEAAADGSDYLLKAMLRFGVRNDRDLSMGFLAFVEACQRHQIALRP